MQSADNHLGCMPQKGFTSEKPSKFIDPNPLKGGFSEKLIEFYESIFFDKCEKEKFQKLLKEKCIKLTDSQKLETAFLCFPLIKDKTLEIKQGKIEEKEEAIHHKQDGMSLEVSQSEIFLRLNPLKLGEGSLKKAKLSLDSKGLLHARVVAHIDSEEEEQCLLEEYVLQKKMAEESPFFVKIDHYCSYFSKDGKKMISFMMEYCDQGTLEDFCSKPENLRNPQQLWDIFEKILEALVILEKHSIHHRDIKPQNIFLKSENGKIIPKIGDFGCARVINPENIPNFNLGGTALYLPPESIKAHTFFESAEQHAEKAAKKAHEIEEAKKKFNATNLRDSLERHTHQAEKMYALANNTLANTRGDIWAAGMILHEMRSGERNKRLPKLGDDGPTLRQKLHTISEKDVRACFTETDELTQLNIKMLSVDPKTRLSAKEAYEIYNSIDRSKISFTHSTTSPNTSTRTLSVIPKRTSRFPYQRPLLNRPNETSSFSKQNGPTQLPGKPPQKRQESKVAQKKTTLTQQTTTTRSNQKPIIRNDKPTPKQKQNFSKGAQRKPSSTNDKTVKASMTRSQVPSDVRK